MADEVGDSRISRRDFLKVSVAALAGGVVPHKPEDDSKPKSNIVSESNEMRSLVHLPTFSAEIYPSFEKKLREAISQGEIPPTDFTELIQPFDELAKMHLLLHIVELWERTQPYAKKPLSNDQARDFALQSLTAVTKRVTHTEPPTPISGTGLSTTLTITHMGDVEAGAYNIIVDALFPKAKTIK